MARKVTLNCRKCGKTTIIDKPEKPGNYTINCSNPACDGVIRIAVGQRTRVAICSNCKSKIGIPDNHKSPQFRCPKCRHINTLEDAAEKGSGVNDSKGATPPPLPQKGIKVAVEKVTPEELARRKAEKHKQEWKEQFRQQQAGGHTSDDDQPKRPMHDPKKYQVDSHPAPKFPGANPSPAPNPYGIHMHPGKNQPAEDPGAHSATVLSSNIGHIQPAQPMAIPTVWCDLAEKRFMGKKRHKLKQGRNTVGRQSMSLPSDISLANDNSISRQSVAIDVQNVGNGFVYTVTVLRATNPVYHNNRPMTKGHSEPLNPNDTLRLGGTTLILIPAN